MGRENTNIFSIDCGLWNFVLDGHFYPNHFINNEAIDKLNYLWTTKENRKTAT